MSPRSDVFDYLFRMGSPRYLTKSRYKLALECPTKLYYTGKENVYPSTKSDDIFLARLAEGGFQVGEMAKLCFPGGHEIKSKNHEEALEQTRELLQQNAVVIYEAAIRHENCFIRSDILIKRGNVLELIEVKAKSYSRETEFITEKGALDSRWQPYIADVAFQRHVIRQAFPQAKVSGYLMLVNKEAVAARPGLNQLFQIERREHDTAVTYLGTADDARDFQNLLIQVNVDREADLFIATCAEPDFATVIDRFADAYAKDERLDAPVPLGKQCASCEFQASDAELTAGKKSGFRECWQLHAKLKPRDFERPHIFYIWNFRRKPEFLENKIYFQDEIQEADIVRAARKGKSGGLTTDERQWLQIQKSTARDAKPYLDITGLKAEMAGWTYPLHFIDFETATVAIPFHKGRRPYESIAFQFSHHTMDKEGRITHAGEFLHARPGEFPNFAFIRELKGQLDNDTGTILRYAPHENTILSHIRDQLIDSEEGDRAALCAFIESITEIKFDGKNKTAGTRKMIDLLKLVRDYYYQLDMGGSNSLKSVLPATLKASTFLQKKYPSYLPDPYQTLPPVFEGLSAVALDDLISAYDARIADGGAALVAYGALQSVAMQAAERARMEQALLAYCKLDTLAMVMLVEAWRDWVG